LITAFNDGSSITSTPFLDKLNLIALNVSFKFGICEIVLAEKIKSALLVLLNIFFANFLFQKFG